MSWTPGTFRLLKVLWRSMWGAHAIAVALDMTEAAVISKLRRARRAEDVDILLADLSRALYSRSGGEFLDAAKAADLVSQPGVRAGLEMLA